MAMTQYEPHAFCTRICLLYILDANRNIRLLRKSLPNFSLFMLFSNLVGIERVVYMGFGRGNLLRVVG